MQIIADRDRKSGCRIPHPTDMAPSLRDGSCHPAITVERNNTSPQDERKMSAGGRGGELGFTECSVGVNPPMILRDPGMQMLL